MRAPDWVRPFYDRKSQAAGPSGLLPHHEERAGAVARFGGVQQGRVLELGAGAGGSAVATALLGYEVVAVELSAVRADFARALAAEHDVAVQVVHDDFHTAELPGRFDAVTCWNGFGVGTDEEQRALLRRMAGQWLTPHGTVLLDVFNPVGWARLAGTSERDAETGVLQQIELDAVGCRFIDTWWFDGDDAEPMAQSLRCYSPADVRLLLEGTGLRLAALELDGAPADPAALRDAWGYRVRLSR